MLSVSLVKAIPADVQSIMLLIEAAVVEMAKAEIDQWDENYPNAAVIAGDMPGGNLWCLKVPDRMAGIISLNEVQPPVYHGIDWIDRTGPPLVVHRLCIHPDFQRKGLAKRLLNFAQDFAAQNGYSSIRLDTFRYNHPAIALYTALGYQRRGEVTFRRRGFYCYEKIL